MRHFNNEEVRDVVHKERGWLVTRVVACIVSEYPLMLGTIAKNAGYAADGFPEEPLLAYYKEQFDVTAVSVSERKTYHITMVNDLSDMEQLVVKRESWDRL